MTPNPDKRGEFADWKNPWPIRGVVQGEPKLTAGAEALRAAGYRVLFDVEPVPEDADEFQDHLNNSAAVRMFNELRMAYVAARLAPAGCTSTTSARCVSHNVAARRVSSSKRSSKRVPAAPWHVRGSCSCW